MIISGIYQKSLLLSPFSLLTDLSLYCFAYLSTVKCFFSCILPGIQAVDSIKIQQKPVIPSLSKHNNLQRYKQLCPHENFLYSIMQSYLNQKIHISAKDFSLAFVKQKKQSLLRAGLKSFSLKEHFSLPVPKTLGTYAFMVFCFVLFVFLFCFKSQRTTMFINCNFAYLFSISSFYLGL